MKKISLSIGFSCVVAGIGFSQNVGIAEPAPNSKLDVVQTQTTGNTIEATHGITTNGSSAGWFKNSGTGYGLHVQNLLPGSNIAANRVFQLGAGANAHGQVIAMNGTTVATTAGQFIDQLGLGFGSYLNMTNAGSASSGYYVGHAGSGDGMTIFQTGTGLGIYNDVASNYGVFNVLNSANIGTVNLMQVGGIGELVDLGTFNGSGVYVAAVNNITTPTAGGDVFAFDADVRTATASTGTLVYGGVIAGVQSGRGHGVLINHSGLSGRNAEFDVTNPANPEPSVFALTLGQGSAVIGQNQNNVIGGTAYVGDFAYTGTDVNDHVGVVGYSQPTAGWGIGVLGQGGWYGMFSLGNFTATGTKAFSIDHPADPENKILRHFSIESNEVLNLYRGVVTLDGNGQALVELPDYFELINANFSYQLTGIGTPQPPYVLSEIVGNTFEVAGEPNTKVSWTVYADRNDPYLQQNPEAGDVIVQKTGERQGKYLNPELYGMPESSAMFPKTQEQTGSQLDPNRGEMKSTDLQNAREKAASKKPAKVEVGSGNPLED